MVRPLEVSDPSELVEALRDELQHCARSRFVNRLHCLILISQGRTCYEVAKLFQDSPRALERWVHRYASRGVDGLRERPRASGRGSRRLTQPQLEQVERDLKKKPGEFGYRGDKWDGPLLSTHLERIHHVSFSVRHCQRLLHQLRR